MIRTASEKNKNWANQIIEAAPDAMLVVDETGRIVRTNARLHQLLGYAREELLNQSVEMLIPLQFRSDHGGHMHHYFTQPKARFMGEGRDPFARRKDGTEVAVEIGLAPLETEDGMQVLANITDIRKRIEFQAQLESALNEKTLLLNEIHHRVKNNLQIVASLLSLQAGQVQDPHFSELISESESRVRAMALLHQVLYEGKNFAYVDLGTYLSRLVGLRSQIYGADARGIQVYVETDDLNLSFNRSIPLGLIVNELLSNAFKHAFGEGQSGEIWVELTGESEQCAKLVVHDNGRGLPKDLLGRKHDTLGMQIVELLTEQIGATLTIDSDAGARFELELSLSD